MSRITSQELDYATTEKLRFNTAESLLLAVGANRENVVERILMTGGVSANIRNSAGACPIHIAAIHGFDSMCRLLHSFGADLDALWDGSTSLHLAASENRIDVVPVLVALGATVDIKDTLGFTPLHLVAIRGNRSLASYLIQAGADPLMRDGDGKTVAERWNFAAQLPSVQREESRLDTHGGYFSAQPPEVHGTISEPALMKVFRSFNTFREEKRVEPQTPTFYVMKYLRWIDLEELENYMKKNIDGCGLPPQALEKKISQLLAPSRKKNPTFVAFEDFSLLWLKAQSMGLL